MSSYRKLRRGKFLLIACFQLEASQELRISVNSLKDPKMEIPNVARSLVDGRGGIQVKQKT